MKYINEIIFVGDVMNKGIVDDFINSCRECLIVMNVANINNGIGLNYEYIQEIDNIADLNDNRIVYTSGNHHNDNNSISNDPHDVVRREEEQILDILTPIKIDTPLDEFMDNLYKSFSILSTDDKNICVINIDISRYTDDDEYNFNKYDNIINNLKNMLIEFKKESPIEEEINTLLIDLHGGFPYDKQLFTLLLKQLQIPEINEELKIYVFGTHMHVQTNDIKEISKNIHYITDVGTCSYKGGIIGINSDILYKMHMDKEFPKIECQLLNVNNDIELSVCKISKETGMIERIY